MGELWPLLDPTPAHVGHLDTVTASGYLRGETLLSSTVKLPATKLTQPGWGSLSHHSADLPPSRTVLCVFVTSPPTYSLPSRGTPFLSPGYPRANRMMRRPIMSTGGVLSCQSLNPRTTVPCPSAMPSVRPGLQRTSSLPFNILSRAPRSLSHSSPCSPTASQALVGRRHGSLRGFRLTIPVSHQCPGHV